MFSVKTVKQTLAINIKLISECTSSKTPQNLDNNLGKVQKSSYTICLVLNCKRLCSHVKLTQRLPENTFDRTKKWKLQNLCVITDLHHTSQKTATVKLHQTPLALLTRLETLVHNLLLCIILRADSYYHSCKVWGIHTYAYRMFPTGRVCHLWQLRDKNNAVLFCCYGFRQTFPIPSFMHKMRSAQLWSSK